MMTDALQQLSTAQAVTTTAVSTNTIDFGPSPSMTKNPAFANISVDESAAAAGAATVQFQVVSSSAADLSNPTVLASSGAIQKSDLVASRAPICFKATFDGMPSSHRYLGMRYTVATGPLTAGKFTAVLTDTELSVGQYHSSRITVA